MRHSKIPSVNMVRTTASLTQLPNTGGAPPQQGRSVGVPTIQSPATQKTASPGINPVAYFSKELQLRIFDYLPLDQLSSMSQVSTAWQTASKETLMEFLLNHLNILDDPHLIDTLGDEIRKHPSWHDDLLGIILASRNHLDLNIAASNTMTLLNVAGFSFAGLDLQGIRIPGANLENANLEGANLEDADLRGVRLHNARLNNANLKGCQMQGIEFSQLIERTLSYNANVRSQRNSPDGRLFVTGGSDKRMRIWDAQSGQCFKTLEGHNSEIKCIAFNKDGTLIATASNKRIHIRNLEGRLLHSIKHDAKNNVARIALSFDGSSNGYLALSSSDGTIKIWRSKQQKQKTIFESYHKIIKLTDPIDDIAFVPNSSLLTIINKNTICIWNVENNKCEQTLQGHNKQITSIDFNSNGTYLVSSSVDKTIRVWQIKTGDCIRALAGHSECITIVRFISDNLLACGSKDKSIRIWDFNLRVCVQQFNWNHRPSDLRLLADGNLLSSSENPNGRTIAIWDLHSGRCLLPPTYPTRPVRSKNCSSNGKLLATCEEKAIQIYDLQTGKCISILNDPNNQTVDFSPDNSFLACGGKTLRIWDLTKYQCVQELKGPTAPITDLKFSPDGKRLITCSTDSTMQLWDLTNGKCIQTFKRNKISRDKFVRKCRISRINFLPGDRLLALDEIESCHDISLTPIPLFWTLVFPSFSLESLTFLTTTIWDLQTGKCLSTLSHSKRSKNSEDISSDKSLLATCSGDTVETYDLQGGTCLRTFKCQDDELVAVKFSPDGKFLASSGKNVHVWDRATGQLVKDFSAGHSGSTTSLCFSPDGQLLATASTAIRIWDIASEQCLHTFKKHTDLVTTLNFSPDNKLLISGSIDKTLQVWNIPKGKYRQTLAEHNDKLQHAAFTTSGQRIISQSSDGVMCLWQIDKPTKTYHLRSTTRPQLSCENANIEGAIGISKDNLNQLRKRGAKGKPTSTSSSSASAQEFQAALAEIQSNKRENLKLRKLYSSQRQISIIKDRALALERHRDATQYLLKYYSPTVELESADIHKILASIAVNKSLKGLDLSGCDWSAIPTGLKVVNEILRLHPNLRYFQLYNVKLLADVALEVEISGSLTLLALAAHEGLKYIVELLIQQGACIDTLDSKGNTPLLLAAAKGHKAIFKLLISKGAHLEHKNDAGESVYDLAKFQPKILDYLQKLNDAFKRSEKLHELCINEDLDGIKNLLFGGNLNVNALNDKGQTPLHVLAASGSSKAFEICQLLLEAGADRNQTDANYKTALEVLTQPKKQLKWIELLLRQRPLIDPDYVENQLMTCLKKYHGDFPHKSADRQLLDKVASRLTGADVSKLMENHRTTYWAHLTATRPEVIDATGQVVTDIKVQVKNGKTTEELEGFKFYKFLPLRVRILLELIMKMQSGRIPEDELPMPSATLIKKLKQELIMNLEVLRTSQDRVFVEERLDKSDHESSFTALAGNVAEKISALNISESYCVISGYKGHTVYITFERHKDWPDEILARIDNLGSGASRHYTDNKTGGYYPYAFRLPRNYFEGSSPEAASGYLRNLLLAKLKNKLGGMHLVYDDNNTLKGKTKLNKNVVTVLWSAGGVQLGGHCVVVSHQVGLQIRWHGLIQGATPNALFDWFLEQEISCIPFTKNLSKNSSSSHSSLSKSVGQSKGSTSVSTDDSTILELTENNELGETLEDGRENHGYTELHIAAWIGDMRRFDALLKEGADLRKKTIEGYTPLHLAALYDHVDAVEHCLKHAPDLVKEVTLQGETALSLAIQQGNVKSIEALRRHTVVPNAK